MSYIGKPPFPVQPALEADPTGECVFRAPDGYPPASLAEPGAGAPPRLRPLIVVYHYSLYDVKGIIVYPRNRFLSPQGAGSFYIYPADGSCTGNHPGATAPPLLIQEGSSGKGSPPQMRRGGAIGDGVVLNGVVLNRKCRNSRPQGGEITEPRPKVRHS